MSEWPYSALITKNGKLSQCNTALTLQRSYMNCFELNREGPHRFSHLLKVQQSEVLGVRGAIVWQISFGEGNH